MKTKVNSNLGKHTKGKFLMKMGSYRNGYFGVKVIEKDNRWEGVDGIMLEWASVDDIKRKIFHFVCLKDWEALEFISLLTVALLHKKKKLLLREV